MTLSYAIDREDGTVTVYHPHEGRGYPGIELDESDLITLLSDLQAGQADLENLAGQ